MSNLEFELLVEWATEDDQQYIDYIREHSPFVVFNLR